MRRFFGLLAAVGLLMTMFPAAVAAAPPATGSGSQTGILCDLTSAAGTVFLLVRTDGVEESAYLAIWAPDADPSLDDPSIVTTEGRMSLDGSSLRAGFELVTFAEGRSTGTAYLAAELTPSSAPVSFPDEGSDGNIRFRSDFIVQLLAVDGTLTIDLFDGTHADVDLQPCGASTDSYSLFATQPNAWVYGGEQQFIACEWSTDDALIALFGLSDGSVDLSQLVVVRDDRVAIGTVDHLLTASTYQASYELSDLATGENAGSGAADAVLTRSGERIIEHEWVAGTLLSTVGHGLAVDGTLSLTLDGATVPLTMDDTSCRAGDVRVQVVDKLADA